MDHICYVKEKRGEGNEMSVFSDYWELMVFSDELNVVHM